MPTNIRIRRGKKANLPKSAPSGMPLWCEDTKELYIGTGTGVQIIHTYDADTLNIYATHTHNTDYIYSGSTIKIKGVKND